MMVGLCECGCGGRTRRAPQSESKRGYVRGEHVRFLPGHNRLPGGKGNVERYILDEAGCWVWVGALDTSGYATLTLPGGVRAAGHRFFYERANGPLSAGEQLHHRCHVRRCVNPAHMEPLTQLEHLRAHGKLSMAAATEIRVRFIGGESKSALGRAFGVNPRTIRDVVDGRTWRAA